MHEATICEVGGAYYPVRLTWLPRVGEFIDLLSLIDQRAGHPARHRYEVVGVVHALQDTPDGSSAGRHAVTVHVKPSESELFAD
jgi:hypothetical protein